MAAPKVQRTSSTQIQTIENKTVLTKVEHTPFQKQVLDPPPPTLPALRASADGDAPDPALESLRTQLSATNEYLTKLHQQIVTLQDAAEKATALSRTVQSLDQNYIKDYAATTGTTYTVSHRLGRPYRGWRIARVRGADGSFYELANEDPALDDRQITLVAVGTFTADIEVW